MEGGSHLPVLVAEVLNYLDCRPDRIYVDATVGSGGHARRILEQSAPTGKVIGLDCDAAAIVRAKQNLASFGERFLPIQKNFRDLKEVLHSLSIPAVDGILADLGVSSEQLDDPERGISFRWEAPLDMRLDPEGPLTAQELIRRLSAEEMEKILRELGEERWAGRIAKAIARQRRVRPLTDHGGFAKGHPGGDSFLPHPHPSGHPHLPGPAPRRERRTIQSRNLPPGVPGSSEAGRALRRHLLPFAGGPDRQRAFSKMGEKRKRGDAAVSYFDPQARAPLPRRRSDSTRERGAPNCERSKKISNR